MVLIETVTLASAASSIEFTSIPQDGVDLKILFSLRSGSADGGLRTYPNGDTSNRTTIQIRGNGSTASSTPQNQLQGTNKSDYTANTFSNGEYHFSNYASSAVKSWSVDVVTENNGTDAFMEIAAVKWNVTDPITSMILTCDGNFVEHSSASLYKITAD